MIRFFRWRSACCCLLVLGGDDDDNGKKQQQRHQEEECVVVSPSEATRLTQTSRNNSLIPPPSARTMSNFLSHYTTYLANRLCGGSSRKLIAGWWYVATVLSRYCPRPCFSRSVLLQKLICSALCASLYDAQLFLTNIVLLLILSRLCFS